jgi:hypothetical protein
MASPFEIFRKNQRMWMAAAVLVAIIAFVIAPLFDYFGGARGGGGRQGPNPVVASWSGGAVRQQQLGMDQYDLQLANQFLRELAVAVQEKGGIPRVPGFQPEIGSLGITSLMNDEDVITRRIIQTEAERLGIQFDDNSVKQFLKSFVDGKLDGDAIQKLLTKSTERRMTMSHFSRVIREELAYQAMMKLFRAGLMFVDVKDSRIVSVPPLTTPSKNWREFLRLNRGAKIRAYPVRVLDYLEKVENKANEKELQDLYNAGKEVIPSSDPESYVASIPAYMSPAKADIEFVAIDTQKITQQEIAKIPEETLRKEYERRVAENQFRVPIETKKESPVDPANPAEGTPGTDTKPSPPSDPTVGQQPNTGNTPPDSKESAPPSKEPVSKDPEKSQTGEESSRPPVLEAPKPTSSLRKNGSVKFVGYQEPSTQGDKPATTPPVNEVPAANTAPTPSGENEKSEQKDAPKTGDASNAPALPSNLLQLPQGTGLNIGEQPATAGNTETVPMRTQTFDEVKDRIANELASASASQIVEDLINQIFSEMNIYQAELMAFQRALEEKIKNIEEPKRPDIALRAKELGLGYGKTGLVDARSVLNTEIGRTNVNMSMRRPVPMSAIVQATIGEGATAFTPLVATGTFNNNMRFVFWKTEVVQPITPSFDTARDQVEETWKWQQALKLAEEKARGLASRVGKGNLEDVLETEEEKKMIVEPAEFTAVNPMFQFMATDEVSMVFPLKRVDASFMETVFSAKPGDTVVVSDRVKSEFYVVQVLQLTPNEELLERFQRAPTQSLNSLIMRESQQAIGPLLRSIENRLNVRRN